VKTRTTTKRQNQTVLEEIPSVLFLHPISNIEQKSHNDCLCVCSGLITIFRLFFSIASLTKQTQNYIKYSSISITRDCHPNKMCNEGCVFEHYLYFNFSSLMLISCSLRKFNSHHNFILVVDRFEELIDFY
jgi:hypothetical protein